MSFWYYSQLQTLSCTTLTCMWAFMWSHFFIIHLQHLSGLWQGFLVKNGQQKRHVIRWDQIMCSKPRRHSKLHSLHHHKKLVQCLQNKTKNPLLWPLLTFPSQLWLWTLKWHFALFATTNWMKRFPIQINIQIICEVRNAHNRATCFTCWGGGYEMNRSLR